MQRVTVTLEPEQLETISDVQEEGKAESKSEAVRHIIQRYEEQQQEYEELHTEYERVKNEKKTIIEQREENTELVEYVEREKDMQERYREAGIMTKAKWAIFGMDSSDDE
jgi:Arc/MetJ-type ribon-helix-helix transcriptional regulator